MDVGGQDTKVIRLGQDGSVENFVMNDKCAAGTGRFLEVMARVLDCPIASLSQPVSYTHLDVYKRQGLSHAQLGVFFLDTEVEGASMQRTVSGSRDGDFLQWAVVSSGGMNGE